MLLLPLDGFGQWRLLRRQPSINAPVRAGHCSFPGGKKYRQRADFIV
jgi:hypothetical protein